MSAPPQQRNPVDVVRRGRDAFGRHRPRQLQFRASQLRALLRLLDENEQRLQDAVYADLRKPPTETALGEIDVVRNDARRALHNVWEWCKPETPTRAVCNWLDTVHVRKDPYGVVLIVGTWCCPLLLLLRPFVGALAAGNCVVLKPSEQARATALLLAELVRRYLDDECYQVHNGGAPETAALLRERFDYVFFTGGERVGRLVRDVANRHLTPVALQLGGKCPTFVDESVDVRVAAKRIVWGKLANAGQTCTAPDYVLCSKSVEERLIAALRRAISSLLGAEPRSSSCYARIVNDAHYERLVRLMAGGRIAAGGDCDPCERYIEPTILTNVGVDSCLMREEIFGPLLPIVNVEGPDEAVEFIAARPKPRAVYVFSNLKSSVDKFLNDTSSGAVVVNDVGVHMTTDNVPFGGVGQSGMGAYGGKYTFDIFTHHKTCILTDLGTLSEHVGAMRYPPYSRGRIRLMRMVRKHRNYPPIAWMKNYLIFCLGVAVAAAYYYYSK